MNSTRQGAVSIRPALESDTESLCSLDEIAAESPERREFVRHSATDGTCYVAVIDQEAVGYIVLSYAFYHHGCIDMLYVARDYRRRGVGSALLEQVERLCKTQKLFTSTNLSNSSMQALLSRRGYVHSGVIHNLDEGDPEVVYFKRLR